MPAKRRTLSKPPALPLPVSFTDWMAEAGAKLEQRHSVRPGAVRYRDWRDFFIQGLSPEQAAEHASRVAYNSRRPAFRMGPRA